MTRKIYAVVVVAVIQGSLIGCHMRYKKVKYVNKPLGFIDPLKRATYILHKAGYTQREIKELFSSNKSLTRINVYIEQAYREIAEHPFSSVNTL